MLPSLAIAENNQDFPRNLLPSLRNIEFVCPRCRAELKTVEAGYICDMCVKTYLLHAGIPDFRIYPDPFLTYEEDYKRTEIVIAALNKMNFQQLLEHYWSFSDITPPALRPRFVRSAILGAARANRTIEILQKKINNPVEKVLEIGSGTGNFLAAAAPVYKQAVGIDVAMRWLHVSRRRFIDARQEVPPLVCCNAEFLPFADGSFDLVAASSTLEFVQDQPKALDECARVLKNDGSLYINSVNRFSVAKDPYSYLWGVGFLPRKWQPHYVRRRRQASYENIKTLSYRGLKRLAARRFSTQEFTLPDVTSTAIKEFSFQTRLQINIYRILKKIPLVSLLLMRFGPGWDVILHKKPNR